LKTETGISSFNDADGCVVVPMYTITELCHQLQVVTDSTTEATASPHKLLGSILHRAAVQSNSPVKASPPITRAQRRMSSPLTRSGRTRRMTTDNKDLFDMSTQVTKD